MVNVFFNNSTLLSRLGVILISRNCLFHRTIWTLGYCLSAVSHRACYSCYTGDANGVPYSPACLRPQGPIHPAWQCSFGIICTIPSSISICMVAFVLGCGAWWPCWWREGWRPGITITCQGRAPPTSFTSGNHPHSPSSWYEGSSLPLSPRSPTITMVLVLPV